MTPYNVKFSLTVTGLQPLLGKDSELWNGLPVQTVSVLPTFTTHVNDYVKSLINAMGVGKEFLKLIEEYDDELIRNSILSLTPNYPSVTLTKTATEQLNCPDNTLCVSIAFFLLLPDVGSSAEQQTLNISCTETQVTFGQVRDSKEWGDEYNDKIVIGLNVGYNSKQEELDTDVLNLYVFEAFLSVSDLAEVQFVYVQFDKTVPQLSEIYPVNIFISGNGDPVVVKTSRGTVMPVAT